MIPDWFIKAFGNAISDVRQRVIEEPFFGKAVTPRTQTITLGNTDRTAGEKSPAERLGWQVGEQQQEHTPDGKAQDPKEHERGIDR